MQSPTLAKLSGALAQVGESAFRARFGALALVGPPLDGTGQEWSFRTASTLTVRALAGGRIAMVDASYCAHLLEKTKEGPFKDTILVGRAATNDIILADESVSKLHARVRCSPDGQTRIFDAGSSNGTFLNERRLAPDQGEPLTPGDLVTFGEQTFFVVDPEGLLELIQRLQNC